jgi:hypothetical protein
VTGQEGGRRQRSPHEALRLESSAFLDLPFPDETVALISGALAATQAFSLRSAFATSRVPPSLGDIAGYALGLLQGTVGIGAVRRCEGYVVQSTGDGSCKRRSSCWEINGTVRVGQYQINFRSCVDTEIGS